MAKHPRPAPGRLDGAWPEGGQQALEGLSFRRVDHDEQPATLQQSPARGPQVPVRRDAVTVEVLGERLVGREGHHDRITGPEPVPEDGRHGRRGTQRARLG